MAYTFNGASILAPLSITSNQPIYETDTVSLSKQRASQGAQRWELSFTTVTTQNTEADMLVGMVTGLATSDTMVMPQIPSAANNNTATTSQAIDANVAAGLSLVTIVSDGIIKKGSFIKFSNHDKIYMVTADVAASVASAPVNVNIYPSLRSAVTTAHTLNTGAAAVLSYYRNIDTTQGLKFTDGILSSVGSISLVEAI
jgi:hypothetical protein